jgi:hypothetical protein
MLKLDPSIFWWKVADPYAGGVPDIFIEGPRQDVWCEVKYIKALPLRETTVIDFTKTRYLSKLQQEWLLRREKIRKDTLVIVGHPLGCVMFWGNTWITPIKTKGFKEKSIPISSAIQEIYHRLI